MREFFKDMWPLAFFYGGAQFVNYMEFGSHYTLTAVAAATGFHALYIEIQRLSFQLHAANRRLWFLANPGRTQEDNPFE